MSSFLPKNEQKKINLRYHKIVRLNVFGFLFVMDKVRIFWEGHKIWKNLPLKICRYWVMSNFKWKIFLNFVAFSEFSELYHKLLSRFFDLYHAHCVVNRFSFSTDCISSLKGQYFPTGMHDGKNLVKSANSTKTKSHIVWVESNIFIGLI